MIHKETVEACKREYLRLGIQDSPLRGNGKDVIWYPSISDVVKSRVPDCFSLSPKEKFLFVRITSPICQEELLPIINGGLVITDCKIVCVPDKNDKGGIDSLTWDRIETVVYEDEQLLFYGYGGEQYVPIHIDYFAKGLKKSDVKKYGPILAQMFTNIANTQQPVKYNDLVKIEISKLQETGNKDFEELKKEFTDGNSDEHNIEGESSFDVGHNVENRDVDKNKSAAVSEDKLDDVDLELMSTIEECVKKTKEIAEYSKQKMSFIKESITKATKEIENCVLEIQKQKINDPEHTQPLINELLKRKEGLLEMSNKVEYDLKEKDKLAKEFNITLFGHTTVGKSTLMEILTNGDGRTIGPGGQRTTTDIHKYKWRGLTITDVPGINAFQGQEDEEKAFAAAKTADIILFMIDDGQPEATEADWLVRLKKLDKPIICLCNVKMSLNSDMDMEMFLDMQNEILDDVSIKEIIAQFNAFVQSKLPKEHIDILVTQLQARYHANKIADERERTALINASRFAEVEKKIIEMVKRNGVSFRQKCFLSIIDAPLYAQCLLMFYLSSMAYQNYSIVNEKEMEFCNWRDEFLLDEKSLLESKINNIFDEAISSIPSFVEDNSERDNFNELLARHIKKLHIDEKVQSAFNKCEGKVIDKVQQMFSDLYKDLSLVQNLNGRLRGNSRIHSDGVSITNWKRGVEWVSAGLGALSAFFPVLIPFTLGASLISGLLGSREEKLKKANKVKVKEISDQLNKFRKERIANVRKTFDEGIVEVLNEASKRFHLISTTLFSMSNSQQELGLAYLQLHSDISRRIVECVLSDLGVDDTLLQDIDFVARVPGNKTIIGCANNSIRKVRLSGISEKIGNNEGVQIFQKPLSGNVENKLKILRSCFYLPYNVEFQNIRNDGFSHIMMTIPENAPLNNETELLLLQQILNVQINNQKLWNNVISSNTILG